MLMKMYGKSSSSIICDYGSKARLMKLVLYLYSEHSTLGHWGAEVFKDVLRTHIKTVWPHIQWISSSSYYK